MKLQERLEILARDVDNLPAESALARLAKAQTQAILLLCEVLLRGQKATLD